MHHHRPTRIAAVGTAVTVRANAMDAAAAAAPQGRLRPTISATRPDYPRVTPRSRMNGTGFVSDPLT